MRIEPVALSHHGRVTHGVFRLPDGAGPFPAVLMSHGYNGCMTDFEATGQALASRGIASLAYTFCGGSTRDESGFPSVQMTLFTEREDALAMLSWLQENPLVDANRLILFGGSMGGLVSVLAAAERPEAAAGLALLFPALCVADDWHKRLPTVSEIPETLDFWGLTLGRAFFASMRDLDVFSLMPALTQPVLLFHGSQDPVVPLAYSQRAEKTFPHAELRVFAGEGHGFSPKSSAEVDRMLCEFAARLP